MNFRLLPLLIIAIIAACSSTAIEHNEVLLTKPHSAPCRMVQHAMGETCIPLNPQRIVILRGEPILHVLALDVKPIIAVFGFEELFNSPYIKNRLNGIEAILTSNSGPSFEKLLLLKPDLIIGDSFQVNREIYGLLSRISPTVLLPETQLASGLYDWKQYLINMAKIFEKVEIANQLIDNYKHRAEELKQTINNHHHGKLSVSYLEVSANESYLARNDSFAGEVLRDVGLQLPPAPPYTRLFQGSIPISEEALPEIDSDFLFVGVYRKEDKSSFEKVQHKPLWSHIRAVQQNQVFVVSQTVWRGYNILAANAALDEIEKYLVNTP